MAFKVVGESIVRQRELLNALWQYRLHCEKSTTVGVITSLSGASLAARDVREYLGTYRVRVLYVCQDRKNLRLAKETFQENFGSGYSYQLLNDRRKCRRLANFTFATLRVMERCKEQFHPQEFAYIVVDRTDSPDGALLKAVTGYYQPKFMLQLTQTESNPDGLYLSKRSWEAVYQSDGFKSISKGRLANLDYRVFVSETGGLEQFVDRHQWDDAGMWRNEMFFAELNRQFFAPMRYRKIAEVIKAHAKNNPRTIIFCDTLEESQKMASLIKSATELNTGLTPNEFEHRLDAFQHGQVKTVIVCEKLDKKITFPNVEMLVFLRDSNSPESLLKQLWQGLRHTSNKKSVIVLDFASCSQRLAMIWALQDQIVDYGKRFKTNPSDLSVRVASLGDSQEFGFTQKMNDFMDLARRIMYLPCTKEEFVRTLHRLAKELDGPLTKKDIQFLEESAPNSLYSLFGNYRRAVETAGLEYSEPISKKSTNEEVLEHLRRKAAKLGRVLTIKDINDDPELPNYDVIYQRFGKFDNVLAALGFEVPPKRRHDNNVTPQWMLEQLRQKAAKLRRTPKMDDVQKDVGMAGYNAFVKAFGSFTQACEAAGLKPNRRGRTRRTKSNQN